MSERTQAATSVAPGARDQARPQRAAGVELIGKYEDSGFKEPPYIVRRADGQTIQLSQLLYVVAENADGRHTVDEIAQAASSEIGRRVSTENVRFLIDKKLRPTGVLAQPDGSSPTLKRADPMLALRFRAAVVPEGAVQVVTSVLRVFFLWPVVAVALLTMAVVDGWVFFVHGVAHGAHDVLYQPVFFLLLLGLVIVSAAFHECGHASACRFGGAKPGVLGAGIYLVWPAFYSDVTDAYRLNRVGRLRTDLGGVYFNVIFMLAAAAAYYLTRFEPLLVFILVQHFEILHQFLPFLRLDGYYVVADLTGVPDLFQRIKPTLASVVPGREPDRRVTELKSWVRIAVAVWVVLTAAFVLYAYGLMVINAPRIIGTALDSLAKQLATIGRAAAAGNLALIALSGIQVVVLGLTLLGIALTLFRTVKALVVAGWTRTEGRPLLRTGFAGVATVAAAVLVFLWLPRFGNYLPIQPNESGTVASSFNGFQQGAATLQHAALNPTAPVAQPSAVPSATPSAAAPSATPSPSFSNASPSATPVTSPSATP